MVDVLNTYRTPENRAVVTSFPVLGIDQVAREIIAGIERGDPLIIPGSVVRMSWRVARLAPGLATASPAQDCWRLPGAILSRWVRACS
jgi:hypothetical protein